MKARISGLKCVRQNVYRYEYNIIDNFGDYLADKNASKESRLPCVFKLII